MTQVNLTPHKLANESESATPKIRLTFEEYLDYYDHDEHRYELVRGILTIMPNPTALHSNICKFLLYQLENHLAEINSNFVAVNDIGVRTLSDTVRSPDLLICTIDIWQTICQRKGAGVLNFLETPQLVIEVTSQNWRDDYILKKAEYAMIEIPEYWIVAPHKQIVKVCTNSAQGEYEFKDYLLGDRIRSPLFPDLNLTVAEMIDPPIVENLIKQEKQATEQLKVNLDQEKQRADQEKQRAEKLANLLRANGIDPEQI